MQESSFLPGKDAYDRTHDDRKLHLDRYAPPRRVVVVGYSPASNPPLSAPGSARTLRGYVAAPLNPGSGQEWRDQENE